MIAQNENDEQKLIHVLFRVWEAVESDVNDSEEMPYNSVVPRKTKRAALVCYSGSSDDEVC